VADHANPKQVYDIADVMYHGGKSAREISDSIRGYVDAAGEPAQPGTGRVLALLFGLLVLSGPRRRPLAGFLYGAFLSRVAGAGRHRLEHTILRLFDQRLSLTTRVERIEEQVEKLYPGAFRRDQVTPRVEARP
jgi:hypothetical protein